MFSSLNHAYNRTFKANKLSLGLVVPLENYAYSAVPKMEKQVERIQLAERLGFSAIWLRDVPFNVPSFGDVGQMYDPFVYLGALASQTDKISLGVASIILPLRHPAHVAKSLVSVDLLSNGRLILGVASGDRPEEYPAMNIPFSERGLRFRESFDYINQIREEHPRFSNFHGTVWDNIELLPKLPGSKTPLLITGSSQQNDQWLAEHGDGWMLYPRDLGSQKVILDMWRRNTLDAGRDIQPAMQPLYIDIAEDPNTELHSLHLGFRAGVNRLKDYLISLESIGINHVAFNLRFNQLPVEDTLHLLAQELLPHFSS